MSFFRKLSSAVLMVALTATMVFAAEKDYTWSLGGKLELGADTSFIFVSLNNTVSDSAFTIELHYDTSKVERLSEKLIGRAAAMALATNAPTADFRRFTIYPNLTTGGAIAAGADSIIKVGFKVKSGITTGAAVSMYLTTTTNRVTTWDTLVVPTNFEIMGTPNAAPVIQPIVEQVATQGKRFSLQLKATDADGDRLVYRIKTSPGEGAVIDSVSGLFTWTPRQSGNATAVFEVSDGKATVEISVLINVAQGNVAPVWAAAADSFNLQEGTAFTHTFTRPTDPNAGDVVAVSAGTLPGGAAFDATTLALSWTPGYDKAGRYEVVLTAQDQAGLKSYTKVYLKVADVNRAPTAGVASGTISARAGEPVSFTVAASDPDRDELTVSFTAAPAMAGAALVNRVFTWRETVAGTYTVNVTVKDPGGLQATTQVQITVTAVNRAPVFGAVRDITVDAGQAVHVNLAANDPDNDALTYTLVLANQTENILTRGATFAGGVFDWTPAASDAGPNLVTVRVADPAGLTAEVSFTITVTAANVSAPVAFDEFGALTVAEGQEIEFPLPLADAANFDRAKLRFWAESLPAGAVWSAASGTVTWTPGLQQAGTYTINCGVSDGNFEDIQQLTIEVTDTDVDPVFTLVPSLVVNEGGLLSAVFEAVDSSSLEPLLFTAEGLPEGAVMYDLGLLYYEPGYGAANNYNVTVTATDKNSNQVSRSVQLVVNDVNQAPEISAGNQQVDEGQTLGFTVTASDPDEDAVTLGVAGEVPAGAEFDGATGAFVWTTSQGQSGNYEIIFTADDGKGGVDSATVIVTVGDVNRPPAIDPVGAVVVREGEAAVITVTASDPDAGDRVTVSAANLPSGATLTQTGTNPVTATIRYTPGYQRQGVFNIRLSAVDNAAVPLTSEARLKLTVQDVDVAPAFTGELSSSNLRFEVNEGATLEIDLSASDQGGDNVTVQVSNRPQGARIIPGNPDRLVFTPGYDVVQRSATGGTATRQFDMAVSASDGSKTVTKQLVIIVNDVNRAPRMPNLDDQVVNEGDLITFQVNATDPDGDAVTVSTAGRVPYLTAGNPPPARVRDGNVFIFDTSVLPQDEVIRSAVFQFWGVDERGMVSDTVQVEIAIVRRTNVAVPNIPVNTLWFGPQIPGSTFTLQNSLIPLSNLDFLVSGISGFANLLANQIRNNPPPLTTLASYAGEEKAKGVYAFTYLAGDLTSQFYGIRRGWQLDMTAIAAGEGADSLVAGTNVSVSLTYNDEDIPTEIPNFSEDRIKVFGFDAVQQVWVLADSQSVDTTTNTATFKLTNPQLVDYTVGAVLDVVAPIITDPKVTGGGATVKSEGVDTLYNLDGNLQFKVNVTDDEVVSTTGVTLYYAVGVGAFTAMTMERSGVNLFSASITAGALADGTVISYYYEARDNMNVVLRPSDAPTNVFQLVVAEYTGTPGDLDGNAAINIFDLLDLLKVLSGKVEASPFSDVDQNGKTDIFDLLALLKKL